MLGSRAIYHDGWKAVTYHPVGPIYGDGCGPAPVDDDVWELYHVAEDVSEARDRAAEYPEKVAELVALWWEEARRNDVLPLDNRVLEAMAHKDDNRRPQATYRYFQNGPRSPSGWRSTSAIVRMLIAVTVDVPDGAVPGHAARGRVRPRRLVVPRARRRLATSTTCTDRSCTRSRRIPRSDRAVIWSVQFREGRGPGGRAALVVDDLRRGGPHRAVHARRLQRGRHRAHVRVRMGARGGTRVHGAVPVQRDHRPGRGVRDRSYGPRPRSGSGRHPGLSVSRRHR